MKVWSSQLWLQFKQSQLPVSPKNVFGASMGFEPMASVLALQCYNNWAMKTHMLGAGQFVEFIVPVKGIKHMNIMWTVDIQMKWMCDHRSCDCNLSNRNLAWKIFLGLQPDSNPWPLRQHCSAPPTELWRPIHWEQVNLLNSSYPWNEWSIWTLPVYELQTYKWNKGVIIAVAIAI